MITVNNIECKEGSASFDRSGPLSEWRGEALFSIPQKTINILDIGKYSGPLFGYNFYPIDISGEIYITNARRNNEGLIESVKFVGNGAPIDDKGKELKSKTKKEIANVYDRKF